MCGRVPPTLCASVDDADQVPLEMTAMPVHAELSRPVPPLVLPIAVPFQTPVPIVPSVVRLVEPAHVESAVFSTLPRASVALRFAVVVPASVPVPDA